ncbi:uncharacterized protein LOC142761393 isoform X2 [Rhinoderma darwinii]|uniref:uncharacterized protein LOC142761393 isoform X2 n=1 Tax=Rhinoderma darwinii TaxID=43563 RepID=UPI003F66E5F7
MDTFSYSITVKCSKELSDKQEKEQKQYFSLRRRSNGGECIVNKLGPSLYRVSFQKKEVKERVLNQGDHNMESQGELIHFTLQEEEANDQTYMQSLEMPGNVNSLMESFRPSENTGLKEITSFVPLDSDFQYEVVKDKIDALCQSFSSLKVCCKNRELILSGTVDISHMMRSARDEIKNIINSIEVRKIEVSEENAGFLTSRESKDISERFFADLPEGKVMLDIPRGFRLYAPSIDLLDQAEAALQKNLLHGSITMQKSGDIVSSEPWKQLWDNLMSNIDIKIYFQYIDNTDDLILSIVGFTEEVKKALKECEDISHNKKTIKEEFHLDHPILRENLEDLLQRFNIGKLTADVEISKASSETVTLIGPREEVEKSKYVLQKLIENHVDHFCITKHGAVNFFANQGKTLIDDIEKKCNCRIFICDLENKKNKAEGIEKVKDESGSNIKEVKRHAAGDKGAHKNGASEGSQNKESSMEKPAPILQLILSFGNLENKKAKALVVPLLSTNPVLEAMTVTKGLKTKGGDTFSNLFKAVFGCHRSLESGQYFPMAVTGESYPLNSDYVIFIACQRWDGPNGSSVMALKSGLSKTLNYCQAKKLHSVAMSIIGPGIKLSFPPEAAASIIGEEVTSFVEREPNTSVKKIELVIPASNKSLFYVCSEKLLEMNLDDRIQLCNEDGVAFPKISFGEHSEVKIGNLSLFVTYNDITKESTDVIVNSTNFSYWNENTVARAIFSVAGQNIVRAAQQGASKDKVVMTEAGSRNLKCKYIMHCNIQQDVDKIPVLVKEILMKCDNVGLNSVAIPAIGTGECKLDAEIVAHLMVDAISTLTKTRNLTFLTAVRLVTFHPYIYYIFCAELKKLSRPVQESSWNSLENQCPLHWDNMNALLLMLVELDPNSEEYKTVKVNFNKTVNNLIKKIERIQNRYQHIAYMLRKRYITEKNGPSHVNEQNLFHGTAPQNCYSINYSGFNRSFVGQNAASYGNGVYFAKNASYSANQTYSPPDPNTGERFIYQVKVLVGRHTKGQHNMRCPPCRTENDPFDYYDSLTDTKSNPNMCVVFHDDQAYPEYLITFT